MNELLLRWHFALSCLLLSCAAHAQDVRIAFVVKALGISFFEAAYQGAQEAAEELDNARVIYIGPQSTFAPKQIEIIEQLIEWKVDAIAISANHTTALVPILHKAREQGIKVISWDSGVTESAREMHLSPSSDELIGKMNLKLANDALKVKGKTSGRFAILSATQSSTNQNIWIKQMLNQLPDYPALTLVEIAYGDDLFEQSYRESIRLMNAYAELDVIVAPTAVGIVAAAKAVVDEQKIGQVFVTGLGLPSELRSYVKQGVVHSFAIWNPVDLGYAATTIAYNLVIGNHTDKTIPMGRMGVAQLDENNEAVMSDPFIYDAYNVDEFSAIF